MIIGFLTLVLALFGVGGAESFYLDDIDKGIKKYVDDKDRKKELQGIMKQYQADKKAFDKRYKQDLKDLQQTNLDQGVLKDWYDDFFRRRLEEREELQDKFIDKRIQVQAKITDDEWAEIISMSQATEQKAQEKADKKKKDQSSLYEMAISDTDVIVQDEANRQKILDALKEFEDALEAYIDTQGSLNPKDSETLISRTATKADFQAMAKDMNDARSGVINKFTDMIVSMKENSTADEYKQLIKKFNKAKVK